MWRSKLLHHLLTPLEASFMIFTCLYYMPQAFPTQSNASEQGWSQPVCCYSASHPRSRSSRWSSWKSACWPWWHLQNNEGLLQCYYWSGMDADIAAHLIACHPFQRCCQDERPLPVFCCYRCHNQLKQTNVSMLTFLAFSKHQTVVKKFVLCMTDAFKNKLNLCLCPAKKLQL